jgi:hypothetical protein
MRILRDIFREVQSGLDYVERRTEVAIPKTDPMRGAIEKLVDEVIAGKLKGRIEKSPKAPTAFDIERLEMSEHSSEKIPGQKRKRHSHRRVNLSRSHVVAAKLYERDRRTRQQYDDNGEPVSPVVSIILVDGTRIEVPAKKLPAAAAAG